MKILRYSSPVFMVFRLLIAGQRLQHFSRITPLIVGENSGYYDQWLREKVPANVVFLH